jgi:iron(III) transport system ATP-binding protein
MTASIELDRVSAAHDGRAVLDDLTLTVGGGEVVAVLGPSGCGKTTLLRLILGFVVPGRGEVRIGGVRVSRDGRILVPPEERGVGVVFQDLALWPHLTVGENLDFGLAAQRVPRPERDDRIKALLARLGLAGKEDRRPGDLSGGERQRVAIARALVLEPRVVLLDEPLANLDVSLKRELLEIFSALFAERGVTALYVTHDLREAVALGHRIVVMQEGRAIQAGTLELLRHQPASDFVRDLVADLDGTGRRA